MPDSSEIRIQSLAISGNEDDRFDVLISYSRDLPDGTVESRLLSYVKEHPDSTNANFFNQNGHFEILADGDSYSDIQVSDDIVWWQQHNGRATEVVAAVKDSNASVAQFWSKPFQVTSSANLESDAIIAIDPSVSGGGLIAVYHVQPPANPNDPLEPPVGTSAGIPTSANVGSPLFTVSPEITIDGPMVSETGERGTIGQTTTATARIRNTGLVGDNVTISYYGGPDGNVLQGFETTFLGSNAVFDASFDFPIAAGVNTLRIEALLGAGSSNTEVYGAHDNSAQIVVEGFNDLAITFYALTNEQPVAGETIDVFAVLQNFGASPQTFAVEFAARNINDPQQDMILDTLIVTLAGDTFSSRTASWTVPNSGGEYELVTRIDTQDVVLESIEHNNQRRMKVRVVPDLSFQCPPLDDNCLETPPSINVFGTSGISNGELQFVVHNNGSTELTSVPLEIHRSRNGGPFVFHRSLEIESIAAHESRFIELGVDVLDGRSTFQIVIDPNLQIDEPRFNNVAYVDVEFRGLADFSPGVPILERPSISGRDNVVRTTIHNLGIADERDVLVEVFAVTTLLDLPIRRLIGSMRVPTIAALDHHDVRIPIATQELLGPLEIVVQVNRNHDNVERTDTNNHSYLFSDWTTLPPKIAFVADRLDGQTELFRSSGDNGSGTALLKNIGGSQSSEPRELTVVGEDLYFAATGADGEVELFRTTNQGSTTRVKDIAGPLSSKPHELTEYDGLLFFVATGPDGNTELYKSDGTNTGTTRVKNLSGSTSSDPMGLTVMGDALYFSAASNTGERELYRSDGSGPGTYRVANLYGPSVSANPDELTVVQDTLYFVAETPNDGRQLHKSDGTHAGTTLVATIDHLTPEALTPLWDDLYFRGVASDNTAELWKTDGTQGGTYEVRDLYGTTDADPNELIAFDGKLLFVANTANGQREVHVTDGSYSGTDILVDLHGAISARPQNLTVAGGLLFFSAIGFDGERELYTSDGTPTGTIRIKDIGGPVSSSPRNFSPVGSELYFSATMSNGEEELFRSDGTAQGTYLVKNLAGSPAPREIVAFDYIQPQELVEHSDYTVSLAVVFAPQMESVKRRTPIYPRLVARLFEQIGQEAT